MKIREGFVSNSSSSSFICKVCGQVNSGWDASLSDFDMVECEAGHTSCEDHIKKCLTPEQKEKFDAWKEEDEESGYGMPAEFCPLCTLKIVDDANLVAYLLKTIGKTEQEVVEEICAKYEGDYQKFKKDLK